MTDTQEPSQSSPLGPQYSIDPRLIASLYGMAQEDEIDLFAYWGIIKKRWKLIASVMLTAAIIATSISLLLPNIYRAQVLMAPVNSEQSSNGNRSHMSALEGLGGLASLAGVNLGSTSSSDQNLAVLQSRTFLWDFVRDNKLMPVLFAKDWDSVKKGWKKSNPKDQPSLWDAYRLMAKQILVVSTDKDSGLVTVSVNWTDPVSAANWANQLVARLNDYLRKQAITHSEDNLKYLNEAVQRTSVADVRQALFALIAQEQKKAMIANTQKQYAFQVLDAAAPPDKKAKPHRSIIVIFSALVAGLLAMIFVLIQEGIRQRHTRLDAAAIEEPGTDAQ